MFYSNYVREAARLLGESTMTCNEGCKTANLEDVLWKTSIL